MNGKMGAVLAAVVALACGGVSEVDPGAVPAGQGVAIAIAPLEASVAAGGTVVFEAVVTGAANTGVSWSVEEGDAGGTVSASGLYTAPATAGSFHVVVASLADAGRTARATVTVGATPPPADPTLRTVAQWETLFLGSWEGEHTGTYLPYSTSRNSWKFYNLGYAIDGLGAMFEATGNTRYLDRALLYVENVIGSAVPSSSLPGSQYKDAYLGWGAWDHPTDSSINGGEYPLFESYCFRYVGQLLRAMRGAPAVYGDVGYRARYDAILAFTKTHMFEKWRSRGSSNLYRVNTHMTSHWAFIALDLWVLTADPVERARYRAVVDDINLHLPNYPSSLRQQMRPHPTDPAAYTWSSAWGSTTSTQDVAHGNGVLAYLVEANRHGVEWTADDMRRFVRTLDAHVWPAAGQYAGAVDGSGAGNGWFNDGFCKLGRYDAALQKRLEQHGVGRGMQLYGNGALNARLLNGG